jgi:D-apiose dehydrogenase
LTDTTYRGALIGCGFFSHNHMNGWRDLPGAEIVAVCDRDEDRARAMAEKFGIAKAYADAEEMLAAEVVDFVDIATTAASHRPLVELACRHAKTVICQKPFAENFADGEAMVAAAKAEDASLIIHENFRWQKPFVDLKAMIDEGRIGAPHFARFSFRHGYDNYVNQPYLAEIERFTIMDVGLHLFDLARHFMGEAKRLSCTTQRLNPKVKGEDAFTALIAHAAGATSVCDCSFQSVVEPDPFPRTVAWIEGPGGSLSLDAEGIIHLHTPGHLERIAAAPEIPGWGEAPWHFVQDSVIRFQQHAIEVMAGRVEGQPSGAHNLRTLALALAAYEAAEKGTTIDMTSWSETT